jgi:hypothetical protein
VSRGQHSNDDWRADPVKTFYIGLAIGSGTGLLVILVLIFGVIL